MVEALLRDGSTSVPVLSADLPISRQAVAKHLAALEDAGLLERLPGAGREVRYGLRGEALAPAAAWLRDAEASWDGRLARLKGAVEQGGVESPRP
jgi:DNA-binding transcriptional ArsR family regulator